MIKIGEFRAKGLITGEIYDVILMQEVHGTPSFGNSSGFVLGLKQAFLSDGTRCNRKSDILFQIVGGGEEIEKIV